MECNVMNHAVCVNETVYDSVVEVPLEASVSVAVHPQGHLPQASARLPSSLSLIKTGKSVTSLITHRGSNK